MTEEKTFTDEQLEEIENSHYDLEVWEAGIEAGIDFHNIEEAYSGKFDSDEDFAQDMAEQTGAIEKEINWPYTCIDWEYAARELMFDYSDENNHYFRNF